LRSETRAACAQNFALWQQATIEIMLAISLIIACSRYIYNGVIFHAHPVRSESHNQRNAIGEVATLPLKSKKTSFFAKFFTSCLPSDTHACVYEKIRDTPLKNVCNFKRSNTIRNSEILLNVTHKMKCLTDQFKLHFCFRIDNTK